MPSMYRSSKKADEIFHKIMGTVPSEGRRYSIRKDKSLYEKQGHAIQGNVDVQRNVYEK